MKSCPRLVWVSTLLLFALLIWDASGLDLLLAHWVGDTQGFPHRNEWLFTTLLHDDAKWAAWGMLVTLCLLVIWPIGPLTVLPFARRLQLPAVALIAIAIVSLLKAFSGTSCPWDLTDFGGFARQVSHWNGWWIPDGGGGHCFPAGHAASGFAFIGGWFALRKRLPPLAKGWLTASLAAGFLLGIAQQIRGAHFMSHTLWTGWICWLVGWLSDPFFSRNDMQAEK